MVHSLALRNRFAVGFCDVHSLAELGTLNNPAQLLQPVRDQPGLLRMTRRRTRMHQRLLHRRRTVDAGCHSSSAAFLFTREDYELEASPSPASTCSTSAARRVRPATRALPNPLTTARARVPTTSGGRPPNALLDTRALQPTKENLRCARVCDGLLAPTTLDLRVTRGLALTARCAVAEYEEYPEDDPAASVYCRADGVGRGSNGAAAPELNHCMSALMFQRMRLS